MISKGVIQEYIADVNFTTLGYRICYIVTKQEVKNGNKTKVSNNSNSSTRCMNHFIIRTLSISLHPDSKHVIQ